MNAVPVSLGCSSKGLDDVWHRTPEQAEVDEGGALEQHGLDRGRRHAATHAGEMLSQDEVAAAFGDHDVPSTLLGVTVLGYPEQLVEIEAIAVAPAPDHARAGVARNREVRYHRQTRHRRYAQPHSVEGDDAEAAGGSFPAHVPS